MASAFIFKHREKYKSVSNLTWITRWAYTFVNQVLNLLILNLRQSKLVNKMGRSFIWTLNDTIFHSAPSITTWIFLVVDYWDNIQTKFWEKRICWVVSFFNDYLSYSSVFASENLYFGRTAWTLLACTAVCAYAESVTSPQTSWELGGVLLPSLSGHLSLRFDCDFQYSFLQLRFQKKTDFTRYEKSLRETP